MPISWYLIESICLGSKLGDKLSSVSVSSIAEFGNKFTC